MSNCESPSGGACVVLGMDGSVYIRDTQLSDTGTYTCVATNTAGQAVYEVHVLVTPSAGECSRTIALSSSSSCLSLNSMKVLDHVNYNWSCLSLNSIHNWSCHSLSESKNRAACPITILL